MTHRHPYPHADLQEVLSRNHTAVHLVGTLARANPTNAPIWEHLTTALSDARTLADDLGRLRTELDGVRYERANLIAAAEATLAAHREGERDPLWYLRDELAHQSLPRGAGEAK